MIAYVDTSCLLAIAFGERGAAELARRLEGYDELFAATLLEAELRSAWAREGVEPDTDLLTWVSLVAPDGPLSAEIDAVLHAGYLRGADLWHLACALWSVGSPVGVPFLTLDAKQRGVAAALGFAVDA